MNNINQNFYQRQNGYSTINNGYVQGKQNDYPMPPINGYKVPNNSYNYQVPNGSFTGHNHYNSCEKYQYNGAPQQLPHSGYGEYSNSQPNQQYMILKTDNYNNGHTQNYDYPHNYNGYQQQQQDSPMTTNV